jgi:hypothetical protein
LWALRTASLAAPPVALAQTPILNFSLDLMAAEFAEEKTRQARDMALLVSASKLLRDLLRPIWVWSNHAPEQVSVR